MSGAKIHGLYELPGRSSAAALRSELSARNVERAKDYAHELTFGEVPSVIYSEGEDQWHGNFLPASYRNICATPEWKQRLKKVYTASRYVPRSTDRQRFELDCANSSDALLMNVFCYPGVLARSSVCAILGVEPHTQPHFGFQARTPLRGDKVDRTEIDLKLGNLLIEAKLTEANFQTARFDLVQRYRDFDDTFDLEMLDVQGGIIRCYQLIRGVLAAVALNGSFCVLCDQRRQDLIEDWYRVVRSVLRADVRCRLKLLTWQELAGTLSRQQRRFLSEKYGIIALA